MAQDNDVKPSMFKIIEGLLMKKLITLKNNNMQSFLVY